MLLHAVTSTYTCPVPWIDVYQLHEDDTAQTNLIQHFPKCIQFIQQVREAKGEVLIHCQAGVSRSATVAAAYLVWSRGMTVEAAVEQIRAVRPGIEPSATFRDQLELFEECGNEWNPTRVSSAADWCGCGSGLTLGVVVCFSAAVAACVSAASNLEYAHSVNFTARQALRLHEPDQTAAKE